MPFRHFFTPSSDDPELVEEFFRLKSQCGQPGSGPWHPPADVVETRDGVMIRFELAGCRPEDLDLRVSGQRLRLRGRRTECCEKEKRRYRQMEIHYGPFERTLVLPMPVEPAGAQARYHEGMLEIFLPRASALVERVALIEIRL